MNSFRIRLLAAMLVFFAVPQAQAENLAEVYQLAVQYDPLLREADAVRLATMEAKPQARSALLPRIDLFANRTNQDQDGTNGFFDSVTGTIVDLDIESEDERRSLTLQLQQSIFQWDRWVALRQADKIVAQAEIDYQSAQQDMIVRVALRYFNVLAAQDTLESAEAAKEAIARQLEQSEKRFEVGLIAITDVQESQAAYDRSAAAVIGAKRDLATAREFLREITGVAISEIGVLSEDMPLASPNPENEDQWVATAMEQNLALISSRLGVDISRDTVKSRRAARYPQIDLVISRNEFESDTEQLIDGVPSPSEADFTTDTYQLRFSLPIYTGGLNNSRVREAAYEYTAAKELLERISRATVRQTRDAYLSVIADMSRVQSLRQALASTQTALRATEAGYEVGTRTTVDVLDGRRNLFEAETDYYISRYDYIVNFMRLKFAAGILNEEDIQNVNRWLQ